MYNERTIQDVIDFLNELLLVDPGAVSKLVETRVSCNQALSEHPTVQTVKGTVGLLGILNGLFGVDEKGYGPISMLVEDDGSRVVSFSRTAHRGRVVRND